MEKNSNYDDAFDNYSYVRGASRVGDFEDDTISTFSAFHPLAISTSTKSGKDVGSETYCQPNRFRLSLSSLLTTDDDQENRGDTSSLGLLHSGQFKSESTVSKFQASGQGESLDWNYSAIQQEGFSDFSAVQQEEFPDFNAEFEGKELQNNLELIEKDEAQNKADHPFIQEEVMGDNNAHYETSSWSVSRAADTVDDRPTGVLQTSNQSNISVSSFFKRRSASLGHFNGSVLPSEERPSFGLTVVERNIVRHQSTSPGSSVSIGQYHYSGDGLPAGYTYLDSVLNGAEEDSAMQSGKKALSDSAASVSKVDRSNHRGSSHSRDRKRSDEREKTRLTTKPPRVPMKGQVASPSCAASIAGNDASVNVDKSAVDVVDNSSSFLSLTAIQSLLNDVSASGSASMLAREIISKSETVKRASKKHEKKEEKTSAVNSDTKRDSKKTLSIASNEKKDKVISANLDALPESSTESHAVPVGENVRGDVIVDRGSAPEENASKPDPAPADSIVVEMKVGGILYKGILYAQPSLPDSGRSSS